MLINIIQYSRRTNKINQPDDVTSTIAITIFKVIKKSIARIDF